MDTSTAIDVLQALGCGQDPIYLNGEETTPDSCSWLVESGHSAAGQVRIKFHPSDSRRRRPIRGTLKAMVEDRFKYALKPARIRR